jgi:hypothetical protein
MIILKDLTTPSGATGDQARYEHSKNRQVRALKTCDANSPWVHAMSHGVENTSFQEVVHGVNGVVGIMKHRTAVALE